MWFLCSLETKPNVLKHVPIKSISWLRVLSSPHTPLEPLTNSTAAGWQVFQAYIHIGNGVFGVGVDPTGRAQAPPGIVGVNILGIDVLRKDLVRSICTSTSIPRPYFSFLYTLKSFPYPFPLIFTSSLLIWSCSATSIVVSYHSGMVLRLKRLNTLHLSAQKYIAIASSATILRGQRHRSHACLRQITKASTIASTT